MKLKSALVTSAAAIAMIASHGANAQSLYGSVFGGYATNGGGVNATGSGYLISSIWSHSPYTHVHAYGVTAQMAANSGFENGWVVGAAMGVRVDQNFRVEAELAYRNFAVEDSFRGDVDLGRFSTLVKYSKLSTITGFYVGNTNVRGVSDGDLTIWSMMANVWYDFDMGDSPIVPFVGAGLGVASLGLDYSAAGNGTYTTAYSATNVFSATARTDDSSWAFAYQFGAGVGYDFGGGLLTAQYRYFGTRDADVGFTDIGVESHNFMIGASFPLH